MIIQRTLCVSVLISNISYNFCSAGYCLRSLYSCIGHTGNTFRPQYFIYSFTKSKSTIRNIAIRNVGRQVSTITSNCSSYANRFRTQSNLCSIVVAAIYMHIWCTNFKQAIVCRHFHITALIKRLFWHQVEHTLPFPIEFPFQFHWLAMPSW